MRRRRWWIPVLAALAGLAGVGAAPALPRPWNGDLHLAAAVIVFIATYAVIALGKLPWLRIDRAGAAVLGAALMLVCGALTPDQAWRAVDLGTLALLFGMMILVGHLRLAGFFGLATQLVAARARHPVLLLTMVMLVSGGFSAVLVNDTACLALTPLVLALAQALRRDPAPYLLATAMAANVGSAATLTGNPQNMLVGSMSGIPYGAFAATLAPVAGLGLVVTGLLVLSLHPREFLRRGELPQVAAAILPRLHKPLLLKSALAAIGVLLALFAGVPPAEAALAGGGLLLLIGRVRPEKIWREVDWPLLMMFAGLFVVVAGFERSALSPEMLTWVRSLGLGDPLRLSIVTTMLSNLVSNVPAVLVLRPFVEPLAGRQHAWLIIAMASTFAGNLTLVGSVANLIVAQRAAAERVEIGFWHYAMVGVPVTISTIAIGLLWLR